MIYLYTVLGIFALVVIFSPLELLLHYWAIMNLARVRDAVGLSKTATVIGTYMLLRGYLLDLLVNVFWMTALLFEWPRELTVTARINRHTKPDASGRKTEICTFIQNELLRWFDAKHPDGIHR